AQLLRVPATRLHKITNQRRSITADTALRLARYFGGDAQSWLNVQTGYDLEVAELGRGAQIRKEVAPRAA
ncbi:MAG TPA: HigA family addiction module antitoxin, partial [Cellvibrionaceae bacterium]|nr:HigA family addiction module antitoxin [Cellvibrionaceae bacterium]